MTHISHDRQVIYSRGDAQVGLGTVHLAEAGTKDQKGNDFDGKDDQVEHERGDDRAGRVAAVRHIAACGPRHGREEGHSHRCDQRPSSDGAWAVGRHDGWVNSRGGRGADG